MNVINKTIPILLLIILIIVGCIGKNTQNKNQHLEKEYIKSIKRDIDSPMEYAILNISESLNLSKIFNITRYYGTPSFNSDDYVWANFIDLQLLTFYESRIDFMEENNVGVKAELKYEANIFYDVIITIEKSGKNYRFQNSLNESIIYYDFIYDELKVAISNNTTFELLSIDEFEYVFENCYLVEMIFYYREQYGPTSGFSTTIYQNVIVDENYNVKFISIYNGGYKIS